MQSIVIGIGLSIIGMGFAAFGFITPILAAVIQEIIDVGVTINALRAAK
jgi:cation transport ATPase